MKEDDICTDSMSERNTVLKSRRTHYLSMAFGFPLIINPVAFPTVQDDGTHISLATFHISPLFRGTVTLISADPPNDDPICDRFILRRAIRENLRLVEIGPLDSDIQCEAPPAGAMISALTTESIDRDIDARIRVFTRMIAHPMGTCALGAVLDGEFRVKGV
jgi:choline dehydrogenase-like flavoprotein